MKKLSKKEEKMRSKNYLYEFLILLIWIGVIVILFKFIPNKQVASVFAGIGFILWPILFIVMELKRSITNKIHLIILILFLVTNAIPIFLMRILNWGVDFSSLSFLGIRGTQFHAASNILYFIMMGSTFFSFIKSKKNEKKDSAS